MADGGGLLTLVGWILGTPPQISMFQLPWVCNPQSYKVEHPTSSHVTAFAILHPTMQSK